MIRRSGLALVAVALVASASPALAQPREQPSARERAYADRLGEALGRRSRGVERLRFQPSAIADRLIDAYGDGERDLLRLRQAEGRLDPEEARRLQELEARGAAPAAEPSTPPVTGVAVDLGDTRVERLKFPSAEEAQRYLAGPLEGEDHGVRPRTAELRGDQLVIIEGEAARDPEQARRAREAAWQGLPVTAPVDASFTDGEEGLALSTRLKDGPVRAAVDKAIAASQGAAGRPGPMKVDAGQPGDPVRVENGADGFRTELRSDEQGASVWFARTPAGEAAMKAQLAGLGGHPNPVAASGRTTEGAAGVLNGLFGN